MEAFVGIKEMNGLQAFFKIVYHIIIKIRLQHIFNGGSKFFFHINNIGKDRSIVIPPGIFV